MSSDCPLDVDVRNKLASVGSDIEPGIRQWIEGMTGERVSGSTGKALKNGVLLCKLANKIKPGSCKFQDSAMPFVQMENINSYLSAARKFGVPSSDLFMTVDLFEEKNIGQVIRNLDVLRRITNTGNVKSSPAASSSYSSSSVSSPPTKTPSYGSSSSYSSPKVSSTPSYGGSSSPRASSTPSYSGATSPKVSSTPSYSGATSPKASSTPSYSSGSSSPRSTPSYKAASSTPSYNKPASPAPVRNNSGPPIPARESSTSVVSPRVPVGVGVGQSASNESYCPLDKDIKEKLSLVGSGGLEEDIRGWVEKMTGERFSDRNFGKSLKNGVLLCKLANRIRPNICPKVQNSPAPFVQMENINSYLNAARTLGVPASDLFMTVDLFEEKNIGQVIRNLDVLRRVTGR